MGEGKYFSQLNYLARILKDINLLDEYNQYPEDILLSLSEIRKLQFEELWRTR